MDPSTEEIQIAQNGRAIQSLLFSVFDCLEATSDRRVADIAPHCVQRSLNPWISPEEHVAALNSGRV